MAYPVRYQIPSQVAFIPLFGYAILSSRLDTLSQSLTLFINNNPQIFFRAYLSNEFATHPARCSLYQRREIAQHLQEILERKSYQQVAELISGLFMMASPFLLLYFSNSLTSVLMGQLGFWGGLYTLCSINARQFSHIPWQLAVTNFQNNNTTVIPNTQL